MKNHKLVEQLATQLVDRNWSITTAESCTGGGIGRALTAMSGSSKWYEFGFITYSNSAKQQLLNVEQRLLDDYGAVSEQVVKAMAQGALEVANANVAVSVSGVAGPTGGTEAKPVGTVYIGVALKGGVAEPLKLVAKHFYFSGSRQEVREQTIESALELVLRELA